jgi:hypothetical protein
MRLSSITKIIRLAERLPNSMSRIAAVVIGKLHSPRPGTHKINHSTLTSYQNNNPQQCIIRNDSLKYYKKISS